MQGCPAELQKVLGTLSQWNEKFARSFLRTKNPYFHIPASTPPHKRPCFPLSFSRCIGQLFSRVLGLFLPVRNIEFSLPRSLKCGSWPRSQCSRIEEAWNRR